MKCSIVFCVPLHLSDCGPYFEITLPDDVVKHWAIRVHWFMRSMSTFGVNRNHKTFITPVFIEFEVKKYQAKSSIA